MKPLSTVKKLAEYALVLALSLSRRFFAAPKARDTAPAGEVLVIVPGGTGDGVLVLDALCGLRELYPAEKGYAISILCGGDIRGFYGAIGLGEDFRLLDISTYDHRPGESPLSAYRRAAGYFSGRRYCLAWYAARPSVIGMCYLLAVNANVKTGIKPSRRYGPLRAILIKLAYTRPVPAPPGEFRLLGHARVLKALGHTSYMASQPRLPAPAGNAPRQRYIAVCPGSKSAAKNWEPRKYAELINRLQRRGEIPAYLLGSAEDADICESVALGLNRRDLVYDLCGETDTALWVELIRGAGLVIGNDSAAVHLAAAAGTKSVCVAGYWHYGVLFPYPLMTARRDTALPVCVYAKKPPCSGCGRGNSFRRGPGRGNPRCKRALRRGKPALCIGEITVEAVFEQAVSLLWHC